MMNEDKDTLRRVQDGLFHLHRAVQPFVSKCMEAKFGAKWVMYASRASGSSMIDKLDTYALLKTMIDNWRDAFESAFARNEKFKVRNFLTTAFDARNTTAHLALPLTDAEALRFLDAMLCLARAVKGPKIDTDAIEALYTAQRQSGMAPLEVEKPGTLSLGFDTDEKPGALMPWIEVALPHPDVLANRFKQSEFAADLAAVDMGQASEDYAVPENFFRITFLTEGLKKVLKTAMERLTGQGGDPVLGLQTSFGGGKTHTMLAIYHLARSADLNVLPGISDYARELGVTSWQTAKHAVFVGTAKGVDSALIIDGGPKVRTLWGFIAWRLAGEKGLALVADAEANGTNPGSELMVEVFKLAGPSVILLDEVVAFARHLPDDRFEAFLSFIQSLTEAAKMVPNVLLVGSLPESDVEAGGEKGTQALRRLEKVFGRTGSPWLAAHGNETYEIVRRRLFQELDPEGEKARDLTVKAFHDLYKANPGEFPAHCKEARYAELLRISFPIHPELFERLSKDWSTLEKFQRTRGVLRFMANVVSVLWQMRTRDPLIMPARIPIADQRVKASVVYPLDPFYSAVIDSEVDGEGSLPARMEATGRRIGQARAATRAARAVFMCSSPTVGQANSGVNGLGIRLAAAEPGDQLAIFGEALRELHEKATYLYEDGGRYWFSTKPTLNRLADERAMALDEHKVDAEIVRVLSGEGNARAQFARIYAAPDDPGAIDEAANLSLVILPPKFVHTKGLTNSLAVDAATDALTRCRSTQRRYRNTLVFVAPDQDLLASARQVVRKALAWKDISEDKILKNQLTTAQVEDVATRTKSQADSAEKALKSAWNHILWAEKDVDVLDGRPFEIKQTTLLARDRPSIAVSVFEKLSSRGDGEVKEILGPKMLLAKLAPLWPAEANHLLISQIREWFSSHPYLPKLANGAVLDTSIAASVASSDPEFGYADRYDVENDRYMGLAIRKQSPNVFPDGAVLIRRNIAEAQLDVPAKSLGVTGSHHITGAAGEIAPPQTMPSTTTVALARPKRFYGTVELDDVRPIKAFETIWTAIVAELQRTPGAKVRLTLDIEALADDGFKEDDIGVVRDNARNLKFNPDSTGFE